MLTFFPLFQDDIVNLKFLQNVVRALALDFERARGLTPTQYILASSYCRYTMTRWFQKSSIDFHQLFLGNHPHRTLGIPNTGLLAPHCIAR